MTGRFDEDGFDVCPALVDARRLDAMIGAALAARLAAGARERLTTAAPTTGPCTWCRAAIAMDASATPRQSPCATHAAGTSRRRVLHFVFGPPDLPLGLAWARSG
ncbi:MAG: hypothetical protein JF586_08890 [Burkholderiales bacterium]|nr:hypothetical protein [Burkholderiales bacterium]